MSSILNNLERVREQIAQAAAKAGRDVKDVELVAITKTHPAEKVREAVEAGQTLFGENRVQEARAKIPELSSNIRWHFVGHLQKNKVRQALPLFEMIHSVDSLALAQDINRIAEEEGLYPRVLLEVNVAGEGSKFGFASDDLGEQMEVLLALPPVNRRANVYSTAGCGIGRLAKIFCAGSGIARFAREGIQHEVAAAFDGHDARFS